MADSHLAYLENRVMTATPQKLRLMLIEAAITAARQTLEHWFAGEDEQGFETLLRCRGIVTELMCSVKVDETDVTRQTFGLYLFMFRRLTEAQQNKNRDLLDEVIRVLDIERETWDEVCRNMPEAPTGGEKPVEITASNSDAIPPSAATQAPVEEMGFDSSRMDENSAAAPPSPFKFPTQDNNSFSFDA